MPTVTYQIGSSKADGEEVETSGLINITGSGVSFGRGYRYQFFRFINIAIPQGATINSAILKFFGDNGEGTPPNITFYAEKSPDPQILTGTNFNISTRNLTTSTVAWTSPVFTFGQYNSAPDIKSIIQEIVNQAAWQNGNAINIISDVGTSTIGNYNHTFSYDLYPSLSATLTIDYTVPIPSGGSAAITVPKQKDFLYKIYDSDGNYLATWSREVLNPPEFIWSMNGGMGELVVQLKRELKSFGEADDVGFGNIIKCYIQDGDQTKGRKIWEGKINRYEPQSNNKGVEYINVVATSRMLEMEKRLIKSGSATRVAFSSVDPSQIFRSLISMPNAEGILLNGLINDTSTTVSYTFQANTIREGFDICVKLAPQYWYYWLDADNQMNFKVANFDEVDHKLFVGKEISNIRMTKSIENLANRVFFMGGGSPNLYKMYERTSSQSEWGLREVFMKDERVTAAATASLLATSFLDNYDHPIAEIEIEVLDSNIDSVNGYDIERFKPGDIVQVIHPEIEIQNTLWDVALWDVDWWDYNVIYSLGQPLQIIDIRYQFNKCVLRLNQKLQDFQKRIEDIDRNLNQTAKVNLPTTPS